MRSIVGLWLSVLGGLLFGQAGWAQSIVGQDTTIVNSTGNSSTITGGTLSGNNLFHSFTQFGLNANQTATFQLSNPQIANIFARVTGGNPSVLDGNLTIGGTPNFYLMNPAGVIFGPNFQFPAGRPLTATTANGIMFGNQWWSAIGVNDYAALANEPVAFGFTTAQPAAIINRWVSGSSPLTLIAGTVISPTDTTVPKGIAGTVNSSTDSIVPNANITMAAVPGNRLVRITSNQSLLGLEIRPFAAGETGPQTVPNSVPSLAQLITGPGPNGGTVGDATDLRVNADGTIFLNGASLSAGDIYTGNLTAASVVIGAPTGNVTVATIESYGAGININAGKRFQAIGSRQYTDLFPDANQAIYASIVLRKQQNEQPPVDRLSIVYGGANRLTMDMRFVGSQPFRAGSSSGISPIPSNISGTASAIVVPGSSGDEGQTGGGLVIAYANQTFGTDEMASGGLGLPPLPDQNSTVRPLPGNQSSGNQSSGNQSSGGVGSQPLSNSDPTINSPLPDNQNGNSTVTRPGQIAQSSAGSQPENQSCPTIVPPSKQSKILAQRSSSAIGSTACTKEEDDAILKILE
jgi:filamentous hemagglutinin family protein